MTAVSVAPPQPGAGSDRIRLARSAALLAAATVTANAAGYLIAVVGSRRLPPASYGLLGSMLALLAITSVPGLALQAVIARRVAVRGLDRITAARQGVVVGAGCAAVGLVALPGLRIFLNARTVTAGLAATVITAVPLTVLSALQGWLQGQERFRGLAVLVLAGGGARLVGGVVPLAAGSSAAVAMGGVAVATGVVAAAATAAVLRGSRPAPEPRRWSVGLGPRELALAAAGLGGLLVLSNLDLLLARHLLPTTASGRYAALAVVARVAFWLPQAIGLTVLPRLSVPASRTRALRDALLATGCVGAVGIAVTAVAGGPLMSLTFGAAYRSSGHLAWLFALQGSLLALTQLLVVDGIARGRHGLLPLMAAGTALEAAVLLVAAPTTVTGIIVAAGAVSAGLIVAMAITVRRTAAPPAPDQWPASSQVRPTPTDTSSDTSSG